MAEAEADVMADPGADAPGSARAAAAGSAPGTAVPPVDPPALQPSDPKAAFRELESMARKGDEDRWLASRFAPKPVREGLIALYAFNAELAGVSGKVRDSRLGEIRLQWWRDALEGVFSGDFAPDHPALAALAEAIRAAALPREAFDALLAARVCDLAAAPFQTWTDLETYIDATSGGIMRLAARLCMDGAAPTPAFDGALHAASRAWGYMSLLRAMPAWTARGRTFFPETLRDNLGLGVEGANSQTDIANLSFAAHALLDRAIGAQNQIARYRKAIPKQAFAAIGYVVLNPLYIRAFGETQLGRQAMAEIPLLRRQWRLVTAAATGSV